MDDELGVLVGLVAAGGSGFVVGLLVGLAAGVVLV